MEQKEGTIIIRLELLEISIKDWLVHQEYIDASKQKAMNYAVQRWLLISGL